MDILHVAEYIADNMDYIVSHKTGMEHYFQRKTLHVNMVARVYSITLRIYWMTLIVVMNIQWRKEQSTCKSLIAANLNFKINHINFT